MRFENAIKNIGMGLFLQVITALNSLVVSRLILSEYGSAVNGLVMSITQFLAYAALLEAGIGGIIRAELFKPLAEKNNEQISNVVWAAKDYFRKMAFFSLLYFVIFAIVFPFTVHEKFSWLYIFSLVCIMCISTFCEYFFCMTYINLLSADQKIWVINSLNSLVMIISMIVSFISIKLGMSIQAVKAIGILVFMIKPIFYTYYVNKKYKINKKPEDKTYHLKQKGSAFTHNIALFVFNNTAVALITFFLGVKEVSVYAVYFSVASGMERIVTAISNGCAAGFGDLIARNDKKQLSSVFDQVEVVQGGISIILYTTAAILILPFVYVYTKGVSDVEYIRPFFALMLLLSQFIYCMKSLYSIVTLNAGHYKQTKMFAVLEAACNIVVSVVLINKIGIAGVAVGTFCAVSLRLLLEVLYLKKNILFRSPAKVLKIMFVDVVIVSISYSIFGGLDYLTFTWFTWFRQAVITGISVSIITVIIYFIFYKNECSCLLKRVVRKK